MDTNTVEACNSLLERAMNSEKQSEAVLLIESAGRLDKRLDTKSLIDQWVNRWIEKESKRRYQ